MKFYLGLVLSLLQNVGTSAVPCPEENEATCVECSCDEETSFNTCVPVKYCPGPVRSLQGIKLKNKKSKCPYGRIFSAQCTLCECTGQGRDHCGFCFALPTRRSGQSEQVNRKLPQAIDNRLYSYEINGWEARVLQDL